MTMLDRMRRHKGWLKWSLGLVCLVFIFLYVPPLVQPTPVGTGAMTDVLAQVGNQEITVGEFRTVYLQQLQNYQAQSGGGITAEILQSMGIDRQILQQMIDEYAASSPSCCGHFQSTSPVALFKDSSVAVVPPGVQTTASPSTNGDSE